MVRLLAASVLAAGLMTVAAPAEAAGVHERWAREHEAQLDRRRGHLDQVAPLAALVRLVDHLPPGRLEPALRRLVEDPRSHPLVAAQAAFHLAIEEEHRGEMASAAGRAAALGFVERAFVVGPFDAQGRSGLDRVFPPEEGAPDPAQATRWAGKEREVGWRPAPASVFRRGALMLDALLRPDTDAVAYVLTSVRSDRARRAVLRLGTAGPVKVWVGGQRVFERNVVRAPSPDQDAVAVRLRQGDNQLLVKTVVTGGAWRLFLRLTDEEGRPWPAEGRGAVREVAGALRLRAERARGPAQGQAWLDHARALALLQSEDVEERAVEASLRRALAAGGPARVPALLLLAEVARDEDDRREALDQVVDETSDPATRAFALASLGELARSRRRDAAALALFRQALALDAGCWPAALALAAEEQALGLHASALARLDALPADARALARVRRARARTLDGLGRKSDAESELRALWQVQRADLDLVQALAAAARTRGDLTDAASLYAAAGERRPDLPYLALERARLLEGQGELGQARAAIEAARDRLVDEARLHEELGKLLARAGMLDDAVASLQRALVLRPQNPALRRYAERLAVRSGEADRADAAEDLARAHAADGDALARAALSAREPAAVEAPAVILLDRRVARVHGNGLSETFAQRIVHVLTDRAARDNQEFYVRYTPGTQEVEIRRARVWRRDGDGQVQVLEATGRDDRDLSEPWYGLYYDTRADVVSFEDLRPGDVLEIQYTVADVGSRNELADYFGDLQLIGDVLPKRRWDYTLIAPRGRALHFNQPRLRGLRADSKPVGDEVVYRFVAEDVPRVEPEPAMPGFAELAPHLHVSTYRTWEEVGRWYWGLIADQLTPDEAVRRAAREATAAARTPLEKVRALHTLVLESTRYVGLEFGIHGFKPYKVSQVFMRRFGDCKDKASLLYAFLREVGIDSEIVLLRTRRGGRIEAAPASLAVFDHAIVYVPALDLYLDGTAEFSGMAELPSEDQGVMVLRVGPRGVTLAETPVLASAANVVKRSWRLSLEPDGGALVDEEVTVSGQAAPEWRSHYQTPGERLERYGKVWSGRHPGAKVEALEIAGTDDRNQPVVVRARVHVPALGELRDGGKLHLPASSRDADFTRSYARLSQRRSELVLAYPWQHHEEMVIRVPDGWRLSRLPRARRETSEFGSFMLEVSPSADGRTLALRSSIDVQRHRVTPAEYAGFRAFVHQIDAALADRLVLERDPP